MNIINIIKEELTNLNENKILNEIQNELEKVIHIYENINVFHGSDRKFDTFDINKIGSGDGKSLGGWGIYFSDSNEVSQRYVTSNGFLGEFQIKSGNYFDLDAPIDDGYRMIKRLQQLNIDENDIEEFKTNYIDQSEYYNDVNNKQAYDWLAYTLGGEKEASMFLKSMGYLGNTFMDKWNRDARNYVVFDTNSIIY